MLEGFSITLNLGIVVFFAVRSLRRIISGKSDGCAGCSGCSLNSKEENGNHDGR